MGVEDSTFKVNFTSDGIERLRNDVTEKLKEFMGDYTDETLVEYVIVLLRNGRTKDEARNELNVFLGDEDSNSFVTWLWDFLSANLNSYVQSDDSRLDEEAKQKSVPRDLGTSQDLPNPECGPEKDRADRIDDKVDKITENLHNTYAAKKPSHLRSEIGRTHLEEKNCHKPDRTRKSLSPRPSGHRKRNRLDDRHRSERSAGSLATINPSSRLLQFAVRDAVRTGGVANNTVEPNSKRLRSVVATSAVDDSRRRLRSVATVSSVPEVALKAAAEAAEDVLRLRPSGNVFDRLGPGTGVLENNERVVDITDNVANGDYELHDMVAVQPHLNKVRLIKDSRSYASDESMHSSKTELINKETEFTIDIDQDGSDDTDPTGYRNRNQYQTTRSVQMVDDSSTIRYGIPANAHKLKRKYQPAAVVHLSYDETVNIPANANIWKPPPCMANKETIRRIIRGGNVGDGTSDDQLLKENSRSVVGNGNGKQPLLHKMMMGLQKTPTGATGSAGNVISLEEADARSIFVSNVHFAATKDSLSRHFNKFGQVLRVTILTDAVTGQPKGSAYVEFMHKEAAEQATSLDGTSFMSRIIKVCPKGSTQPGGTPWPRAVTRGSPYAVSKFSMAPFPRGSRSSFRSRGIARPGARSLQWKRDAATSDAAASPRVRSLTYVRPELKAEERASS